MRKVLSILVSILLCSTAFVAKAQNVGDLIISEIMPDSDKSFLDDYGRNTGWIEIFNKSQGTVSFSGCYLTDDRNNLRKSQIPTGDARTKLAPRQVTIFFASGNTKDGTFYTDFKLQNGSTVYLVSNDGRTIIDSLHVPENLPYGKSVIKLAHDRKQHDFQVESEPAIPSPMSVNGTADKESESARLAHDDPYGLVLTLVSISVVFAALVILWWLFSLLGRIMKSDKSTVKTISKNVVKTVTGKSDKMSPEVAAAISLAISQELGGETYAAIAAAMHLYLNDTTHDNESFIITIKQKPSEWNSREQGFRQLPR